MRASFIATASIVIVSLSAPTAAELNVPVAARVISFLQLPPSGSIQSAAQQLAQFSVSDALGIDARLGYRSLSTSPPMSRPTTSRLQAGLLACRSRRNAASAPACG
ncbi:hypothetical protein [Sphingomonas sp. Leaf231]|uniref:hypothetical protein n=1 Tax=Sphingomonas sp. Leaf231 TaxID=1736301 RepID=UPI000A4FE0C2|nr:hypothetical protein [Sphingomonas sp. Leaf231]